MWSGPLSSKLPNSTNAKARIGALPAEELAAASSTNSHSDEEAQQIASGLPEKELLALALKNEHRRDQRFKDSFESLAIAVMWLTTAAAFAIGGVWLFHLLTPLCWHWLAPDGLSKLQNIFTGGLIVTVAADHLRKRMK